MALFERELGSSHEVTIEYAAMYHKIVNSLGLTAELPDLESKYGNKLDDVAGITPAKLGT